MDIECSRCHGTGNETYEEEYDRMATDVCYHCSGSGKVDEDTDFQDKLVDVARMMSIVHVREYKKACDEDPDGEGFEFRAAENMISSWEYEKILVYDNEGQFLQRLMDLSMDEQKEYVRKMIAGEDIEPIY